MGFYRKYHKIPMVYKMVAAMVIGILLGAVLGCVAYYILYFFKSVAYDGVLVEGLQPMVALAALPLKFPASIFNAAVAIIAAPPLCIALRAALRRSGLSLKTA